MEANQQFRLKWNSYHVNIASAFDSLRLNEDFVDVTLACDDFQAKAHRVVLSACSPYFRQLLKANPHPHPIVILRDVGRRQLTLLLEYMYHGEVNVAQSQLADFLKVAELLKVKGLADDRPADTGDGEGETGVRLDAPSPSPPPDRPLSPESHHTARHPTSPPVKKRRAALQDRDVKREEEDAVEDGEGGWTAEDLRLEQLEPRGEKTGEDGLEDSSSPPAAESASGQPAGAGPSSLSYDPGTDPLGELLSYDPGTDPLGRRGTPPRRASCPICGRWFQKGSHLREHVASIHYPVASRCELCGKLLRSKASLRTHRIKYHRQVEAGGKVAKVAAMVRAAVPAADGT